MSSRHVAHQMHFKAAASFVYGTLLLLHLVFKRHWLSTVGFIRQTVACDRAFEFSLLELLSAYSVKRFRKVVERKVVYYVQCISPILSRENYIDRIMSTTKATSGLL